MKFVHAHRPARLRSGSGLRALIEYSDDLACRLAQRPMRSLGALVALALTLSACFFTAGRLAGDDALFFRELAPGTWLSFAGLLSIAAIAGAVHRREAAARPWHQTFWGLSAAIFLVFAFDEITQSAIFLSHLLESFGLTATAGFHDLEAVLLALGFAGAGLLLLPRAIVLRRHPAAFCLLAVGALIGAASQGLDSFAPATSAEFVAEETLKLVAEAFLAGGFLLVLRNVTTGRCAERRSG